MMEQSLFVELIHRTKGVLSTIEKLTQLSRTKCGDKEFGEFFYKAVTKDIEIHNVVLNAFLKYIDSTTPIPKKGTVNRLIEETLKENQARLEERKARVFRKCEEDLPETPVPDEQLKFVLDSLLQCALTLIPPGGLIDLSTGSLLLHESSIGDKESLKRNGKYIEIRIAFTRVKGPMEQTSKGVSVPSPQEQVLSNLVYKLVEVIVERNQGTMRYEVDERDSKDAISLRFPVERRRVVYYQLTKA